MTDPDPFGFERLEYVRDVQRSKALNGMRVPMVIISASGMAEHGRILHHLRNNIEDPKSTVMIVGYQAEHTLGKRIVERRDEVKIFGQPHQLKAEVAVLNYFSAHADEPGLARLPRRAGPRPAPDRLPRPRRPRAAGEARNGSPRGGLRRRGDPGTRRIHGALEETQHRVVIVS